MAEEVRSEVTVVNISERARWFLRVAVNAKVLGQLAFGYFKPPPQSENLFLKCF